MSLCRVAQPAFLGGKPSPIRLHISPSHRRALSPTELSCACAAPVPSLSPSRRARCCALGTCSVTHMPRINLAFLLQPYLFASVYSLSGRLPPFDVREKKLLLVFKALVSCFFKIFHLLYYAFTFNLQQYMLFLKLFSFLFFFFKQTERKKDYSLACD